MLKIKLAKREKYIVSVAACIILLFVLLNFAVFPFFEGRERLKKGIKTAEAHLKEIAALSLVYQGYQKGSMDVKRILSRRDKGFTLFSYLERAAGEVQVKSHIEYMKPSSSKGSGPYAESTVEMKLNGINTDQLVRYLYEIEEPEDLIFIRRISVSDNKNQEGYLDSIIQVLTYQ